MAGQLARDELDHGGRRGRGPPPLLGGDESRVTQPSTHFLDHVGQVGRRRRFERKGIGGPSSFERPMNDGDQLVGSRTVRMVPSSATKFRLAARARRKNSVTAGDAA